MTSLDDFTREDFQDSLEETMATILVDSGVSPVPDCPRAFLLGGQSGAGKTTLHLVCKRLLGGNAIVINGDEYRSSHPRFAQIQQRYGVDAPAYTAAWSGKMVEALIDAFSLQGYNLIVEGTLRTSDVPLATARLLRQRGYDVSLAIMAVKPEVSLVSCQIRYEQMRIAGTTLRAVDPAHHERIVHEISDNLAVLEASGAFSRISLYNRAAACLFSANFDAGSLDVEEASTTPCPSAPAPAAAALHDILFGEWTREEQQHYTTLLDQLDALRAKDDAPDGKRN